MPAPQPIRDGFTVLPGGMQGGFHPTMLDASQYARGINVSCRGGMVHTRPGFVQVADHFTTNRPFQGACRWTVNGEELVVSCFNGTLFFYNTVTGAKSSTVGQLKPNRQVFMAQADRYLLVSDGEQLSVFAPGPLAVYTTLVYRNDRLPPCTVMHYAHGRVHLVPTRVGSEPSQSRYFVSGDFCMPSDPATVYNFTEATYLNGGGAFGLPDELGAIRGLASLRNSAQGTGVGALVVLAEDGLAAFDVSRPRAGIRDENLNLVVPGWNDQPIGQVLFYGAGTRSPWSVTNINSDLVYRGLEGIRFLQYAQSQASNGSASGSLSNQPQSFEVEPFITMDPGSALPWVSAAYAGSRMHMTAGVGADGHTFRGILSLDAAVAQTLGGKSPPAYDGLWTGLPVGKVLVLPYDGKHALFVVTSDARIFRLDESAYTDHGNTPIESQLETRSMFIDPQLRMVPKTLDYVDLWVSGLRHDTVVEAYFRPDSHPLWCPMTVNRTLTVPAGGYPQERRQLRFNVVDDLTSCTDRPGLNSASLRNGLTFQIRLVIRGYAIIERMDVIATPREMSLPEVSADEPAAKVRALTAGVDGVASNDFSYSIP